MKRSAFNFQLSNAGGFSLVEILAAVSVLAIMMLIVGQIVGLVSDTWRTGKARVDNFTQARVALGMMDRDVQMMLLRDDLGAFKNKSGEEEACAFYTRMLGAEGDRRLSLVEYFLADPATTPKLMRADYGLNYDTDTASSRTLSLGTPDALPDLDKTSAQEIAEGVLAFRWQFINADGVLGADFVYDHANPSDSANTRTMVLSLLVLDKESYALAKDTGVLTLLLSKLGAGPSGNETYAVHWQSVLKSPDFAAGLPRPVLRSLRVFERSIALPLRP